MPWPELAKQVDLADVQPVDLTSAIARRNPLWLTDQPGATVYSGTMGSTTVPGWSLVNSTPSKVVTLRSAADAAASLRFAAEHNVSIVVKSTGHDWFGRSSAAGALLLWTHHMTGTEWLEDFTPTGCSQAAGPAVALEAGVQFWQLYDEAVRHGRLVVGGTCSTVGHVGFTTGGGYGDFSRQYGSGATNLLEAEVVLADGSTVIANACGSHADLFKALRGGGGAFGIVTKATYRTYPIPVGKLGFIHGALAGGLRKGLENFFTWYAGVVEKGQAPRFGGIVEMEGDTAMVLVNYNGLEEAECNAMVAELGLRCAVGSWPAEPDPLAIRNPDGITGWIEPWMQASSASYHFASLQRYLPLERLQDAAFAGRLAELALKYGAGMFVSLNYALGRAPLEVLAEADRTSVHPQVYTAVAAVKVEYFDQGALPTESTTVDLGKLASFLALKSSFQELLPGAGSYYNEGDYTAEAYHDLYWGSNYASLLEAKKKYDPNNTFRCHQCVGSDAWAVPPATAEARERRPPSPHVEVVNV